MYACGGGTIGADSAIGGITPCCTSGRGGKTMVGLAVISIYGGKCARAGREGKGGGRGRGRRHRRERVAPCRNASYRSSEMGEVVGVQDTGGLVERGEHGGRRAGVFGDVFVRHK